MVPPRLSPEIEHLCSSEIIHDIFVCAKYFLMQQPRKKDNIAKGTYQ
jgi:hypothetical protein